MQLMLVRLLHDMKQTSIRFQAMTTTQSLTKLWLLVLYLSLTLEIKYTKGTMSMRNTNSPTEPIKFEHNTDSPVDMDIATDILSRPERADFIYMNPSDAFVTRLKESIDQVGYDAKDEIFKLLAKTLQDDNVEIK
jgi:hypothetical protein